MELVIKVTIEELDQAVENLVYFIINNQNLNEDVEIDEQAIALVVKQHLESKIEEILSDPEKYLNNDEMSEVEKHISMPYSAYRKMTERDISYPI
jgi:hypothetical protein